MEVVKVTLFLPNAAKDLMTDKEIVERWRPYKEHCSEDRFWYFGNWGGRRGWVANRSLLLGILRR